MQHNTPKPASEHTPPGGGVAHDLRPSQGVLLGNTGEISQQFGDTVNTGGGDNIERDKNISIFSGLTTREMFSLQIVRHYEQLWGLMEPFAEYEKPETLMYGSLPTFSATLRQWYFQDAGGLYMRQLSTEMPTRQAYMNLQEGLRSFDSHSSNNPADTPLADADFKTIQSLTRAVRYALSDELKAYVSEGDSADSTATSIRPRRINPITTPDESGQLHAY